MEAEKIIEGLNILATARPKDKVSSYWINAEHKEIYAGGLDWPLTEEQKQKLEDLGWHKDEDADSWYCFT